jgi:flagellar biosynthetic protein FliR
VIDLGPFMAIGVLLVRPGLLMTVAPCFGAFLPAQARIAITVLLGVMVLPVAALPPMTNLAALTVVVIREAAIGLAIGLSMNAFVAAVECAGHLSGFQMGLSYSSVVDPQSGVRNNVLAVLYANMTLVALLLVNGHHAFLRALSDSYVSLPIGAGGIASSLPGTIASLLGLVFELGVRLAAPLVLVLVMSEVAMSLIARAAPQLNILVVGAPIRLLIGLLLLALTAPAVTRAAVAYIPPALDLGVQVSRAFR